MKRALTIVATLSLIGIAGVSIWAVAGGKSRFCSNHATAADGASCEAGSTAAVANTSGKVLGHFDVAMAGCRFACATKAKFDESAVIAQPGARDGELTQCPVSGVVFTVDSHRPHVQVGADPYVTCCDACAEKLRKNPRRFVRV
jgi:hypothetical protein